MMQRDHSCGNSVRIDVGTAAPGRPSEARFPFVNLRALRGFRFCSCSDAGCPISRALFAQETSRSVPDPSRLAGNRTKGFGSSMILVRRKKRKDLLRKMQSHKATRLPQQWHRAKNSARRGTGAIAKYGILLASLTLLA